MAGIVRAPSFFLLLIRINIINLNGDKIKPDFL